MIMIKDKISYVLCLATVCAIILVFSPFQDTWWPKWAMFHAIASVILGWYFGKKYHWTLGALVFSVIASGCFQFSNRSVYGAMDVINQINLAYNGSKAILAFLLLTFVGDIFSPQIAERLLHSYIFVCIAHSVVVFNDFFIKGTFWPYTVGFLPNVSMGPCMLATLVPVTLWCLMKSPSIIHRAYYLIATLMFITVIVIQQSSMSYATLVGGIVTLATCLLVKSYGKKMVFAALVLIAILWPLGPYVDPQWRSWTNVDRFEIWKLAMQWWWDNTGLLFGSGVGTFRHWGAVIQSLNKWHLNEWWTWLHSDWLQLLFEVGIVGVFASICFIVVCLKRAFVAKRYEIVSATMAYVVMGSGNYPFRLAEFAFLGMLLLTISMKSENIEVKNGVRPSRS